MAAVESKIKTLRNVTILEISHTSQPLTVSASLLRHTAPTLAVLDLSGNKLSFSGSDSFPTLPSLTVLKLRNCQLETCPSIINFCPSLVVLDLSHNNLTEIPQSLWKYARLQLLAVTDNLMQAVPDTLGAMPALRYCHLSNNRFSDDKLQQLASIETPEIVANWLRARARSIAVDWEGGAGGGGGGGAGGGPRLRSTSTTSTSSHGSGGSGKSIVNDLLTSPLGLGASVTCQCLPRLCC